MKKWMIGTAVAFLAASCVKGIDSNGPSNNSEEPFAFVTSKQVRVEVAYDMQHNTRIELYSRNPLTLDAFESYVLDPSLRPLASGYTDENGRLSLPVRLADSEDEIYAYSTSVGAPVLLSAKVTGSTVQLTEANAAAPRAAKASRSIAGTKKYWENWEEQDFVYRKNKAWKWDDDGRPKYLLDEKLNLDKETLNLIDAAIPAGEKFELLTAQIEQIEISEPANVCLYYVSNSSKRSNALAYFTYTGEVPSKAKIDKSLTILYPNLTPEALKPGEGVMLNYYDEAAGTWSDVFPAGVKIGFVLLVDAWDDDEVEDEARAFYSHKRYNRYDIPSLSSVMADRPHMAAFKAGERFILTFEDLPYNQNPNSPNIGDFRDNVFVMTANPVEALPEVPSVDDSGIPPYVTTYDDYGILAFEDNWPYKGDYDLNDVVVKYESKLHISHDFDYNYIEETYTFLNNGGKYVNAFGIEYGFELTELDLAKCTVEAVTPAGGAFDVPGFDKELKKATLMLFDDARNIPVGTQFRVALRFRKPQLTWGFLLPPYNPFITVDDRGEARKEVHLPDHKPTPKADMTLLHTGHDLSGNGRYYVSDAKYPFAIDLTKAESYECPSEVEKISDKYPRFDNWVATGGEQDKDWYRK